MQKVIRELVCDLTGEPADETLEFGLAGKAYEVDLTKHHADLLRETLADYVNVARPLGKLTASGSKRHRASSNGAGQSREHNQAIRDWARQQGLQVSERGRISADVQQQFDAAHAATPEHAFA